MVIQKYSNGSWTAEGGGGGGGGLIAGVCMWARCGGMASARIAW